MPTEIEVKFLDVDHDTMRAKLKAQGATCEHPMRMMRRVMLDHTDGRYQKGRQSERLRIRDEGDKVTITYKAKNETNYAHEVETTVGSFDEALDLFKAIGFQVYSYQESKRETWLLDDVEVVLDEWPWVKTYIEIEGPTEGAIKNAAKSLGFDWRDAQFGSVDTVYRSEHPKMAKGESIGDVPKVEFDKSVPQWLRDRK